MLSRNSRSTAVRLVCVLALAGGASSALGRVTSKEVLKMFGRDHGLCVLIGCGGKDSAALAAELAASGKMLVHGIALDDESLARARKAVAAAGACGFAAVEKLPAGPLPYRDNLANLVVIEDLKAATAAGLTQKEAMRILAPGGRCCANRNGNWTVTLKRRPKQMGEWTHANHGPDGNRVSEDTVVAFPFGLRWNAGLPMNVNNPQREANRWSSTRGLALTGGRCFTLNESVWDNLPGAQHQAYGTAQYVTARDAYNGLLLWRKKLGELYYGGLFLTNRAPFVAVDDRVYTTDESGKLIALDAATGELARTFQTDYVPGRLLVDRGTAVAAEWKGGRKVGGEHGVDRRHMEFDVPGGAIEAFDVKTGRKLWTVDKLAVSIVSADGVVFYSEREGTDEKEKAAFGRRRGKDTPPPARPTYKIGAIDLRTGKELWSVGPDVLGAGEVLYVDAAGLGTVTVNHNNGAKTSILSAADGKVLNEATKNAYAAYYEGAIHIGSSTYDPKTGKETGRSPLNFGRTICTPPFYVNGILVRNRGGGYINQGKPASYGGMRGGCLFSSPAANGALYSPQNWCRCSPGQIEGLVSIGPIGTEPTAEEMARPPAVEKGPAANNPQSAVRNLPAGRQVRNSPDWPMYRRDAARSNATDAEAPTKLDVLWEAKLVEPAGEGPVAATWREYLIDPLTAPVVAEGTLAVAAPDRQEVIAVDAATGKQAWRATVGARVDTPPTIHNGACLVGSHDGYVYSLSRKDGRLAWRMRAAPREARLVSYGQVESPWPVIGTVLVADGVAYASAGRTMGSDGGIAVRAFEPETGKVLWSHTLVGDGRAVARRNDLMLTDRDAIRLMDTRLNPRTGEAIQPPKPPAKKAAKPAPKPKLPAPSSAGAAAGGKSPAKAAAELAGKAKPVPEAKAPAEPAARPKPASPTTGLEGFICWNWTKLGDRRSGQMVLNGAKGHMLSWTPDAVCCNERGTNVKLLARDEATGKPGRQKWAVALPGKCQANCVVVCGNAVVIGGGIYEEGSRAGKGFIQVLSADKGEKLAERTFAAPLAYNGIAVVDGRVYATFADGSAACLGAK